MSLISDALKEAQRKREKRNSSLSPPILPSSERKKKRGIPFLGLTIFAFILVIFSVYLYFQIDRITKVRNRNILKPATYQMKIEAQKPPVEEVKNEIVEDKKEPPQDLKETNKMIENQESEPKEKISSARTSIHESPIPKKFGERNIKPEKIQEEIPLMEKEKKSGQIEIIRSLIESKKSQMEEELLEIEKAERDKDWEKACSMWERIIEKNEKKEYFLNAGVAYKNAGNVKRAEELFLKALELDPQYLSALNNLGVLYLEKNDYDRAIHYFGNALRISPDDPEIYVNMGIAFFKKNEFNKARDLFEEALKINSKLYQPYFYLGVIYLNQNDKERALLNFTKLLDLAPDDFPPELKKWVKEKIDKLRIPRP